MKKAMSAAICAIMMILAAAGFAACAGQPAETPAEPPETPVLEEFQVSLYFVNEEYVVTGDESLERLMPPETAVIEAEPGTGPRAALEALKTVPDKEGYGTMILQEITFNDVYIDGDTAYVDLSAENLNGSSTQEGFLISQIVKTLKGSFADVAQVQFLVDGEIVESLMGHIDASKPFAE